MKKGEKFSADMSYPKNNSYHDGESGNNYIISQPDNTLIVVVVFLVVIGIMAVFSAGSPKAIASGDNPLVFSIKQFVWLIGGVFFASILSKYDYRKLKTFAPLACLAVLGALALVQFSPLGTTVNEAKRWLTIGPVQFQPSEFAKPAVVLAFSALFSSNVKILDDKKIPFYFVFLAILLLIFKQPNLSMIILLCMTSMILYFVAGGGIRVILTAIATAIPVIAFTILGYQKQRIIVWLDPQKDPHNAGYNIIQSLVAFAGGGFFGVGYGNSKQKLSWLPEGHTDFIFSVIAEEFGFLGCFFIIGLFMMFAYRGFIIAKRCPDMFGKLLAVGITFSICFQALMNISVASSFLPATGIPLPFISYGGSSLFVSLCMVGVLLNISKKRVQRIRPYAKY